MTKKHILTNAMGLVDAIAPENVGKIFIFIIRFDLKFQNQMWRISVCACVLYSIDICLRIFFLLRTKIQISKLIQSIL